MGSARQGGGTTVVYVGPSPERAATVAAELSARTGFEVEPVAAADDALATVAGAGDVDCLVAAYELADADGIELVERVRGADSDLPVVLFPRHGSEAVASRALAAGVTDYVPASGSRTDDSHEADGPYDRLADRVREHASGPRRSPDADQRSSDAPVAGRHRRAIEAAREGIAVLGDESRFQYVNEAYAELFGRDVEDLLGEHWTVLYSDEEVERLVDAVAPDLTRDGYWRGESRGLRADGTEFVADHVLSETAHGEVICTVRDATERRETDRRYRTLVDTLPGVVYRSLVDDSWPVEDVAGECEQTTGYTASELRGDVDWEYDVMHPEDRARVRETVEEAVADGDPFELTYRVRTPEDEVRWLWERGREVEDGVLEGFVTDVTERKERQRELQATNAHLEAIIEASPAALVAIDLDGEVQLWNPAAERIFGWSEAAVLGEQLPFVTDEFRDDFEALEAAVRAGEHVTDYDTKRVRKDGTGIDVNLSLAPLRDPGDEIVGVMGAILDVTERTEQARALQCTRNLLESVERLADVGGWEYDLASEDVTWTTGTRRITDAPPEFEPTVDGCLEFVHPDDRAAVRDQIEQVREAGAFDGERVRVITAAGRERWVRLEGEVIEREDGSAGLRGYVQDVTERTRRDHQVAVLDRVLQHNLTTAADQIVDGAESIAADAADAARPAASEGTIARDVDGSGADGASIADRARRIAETASELVTLANKHREIASLLSEPQSLHSYCLRELLRRPVEQMQATYPGAELSLSLPESVEVTATAQIEEAVAELVENAIRHCDVEPAVVEVTAAVEREAVEIRIADNGPGVPDAERAPIGRASDDEPFAHGEGLGLWLAKWTVSRTGGTITFEENDPRGTVVSVRLPREPGERVQPPDWVDGGASEPGSS